MKRLALMVLTIAALAPLSACTTTGDLVKNPDDYNTALPPTEAPTQDATDDRHQAGAALALVKTDAIRLASGVERYRTEHREIPGGDVEDLSQVVRTPLRDGNRVAAYLMHPDGYRLCVVNDTHGAWAFYDAADGAVVDAGTGATAADLAVLCTGEPTPIVVE